MLTVSLILILPCPGPERTTLSVAARRRSRLNLNAGAGEQQARSETRPGPSQHHAMDSTQASTCFGDDPEPGASCAHNRNALSRYRQRRPPRRAPEKVLAIASIWSVLGGGRGLVFAEHALRSLERRTVARPPTLITTRSTTPPQPPPPDSRRASLAASPASAGAIPQRWPRPPWHQLAPGPPKGLPSRGPAAGCLPARIMMCADLDAEIVCG